MLLKDSLSEHVRACFTAIWIESHEHQDALVAIAQLCREEGWKLATWNVADGLCVAGTASDTTSADPLAAIRSLNSLATPDGTALLVLQNFHRLVQSAEIVQALAQQILAGKLNRTFIVVLAPTVQIPLELEKLFVVLSHELPDREQLTDIATGIATEVDELPGEPELSRVLEAAAGLTRYEAEAAFSLSLVRHQRIEPTSIWELKSQILKKSGLLSLHRGSERFDELGGLNAIKSFCLRSMRHQGNPDPLRRPRGVLLLSPPGCGKSQFAKSLGNEVGRPTLTLDVGSLYGSLVGETERNVRQALQTIDAMAPCVCFIDELEKGLAGAASGSQSDSGVSTRLFGSLLTWMNDRTSDVYLVGTCNDISKLPPELTRAERWDGIYFLDLPSAEQRRTIWNMYVKLFELEPNQKRPQDDQWSGAEIRSCCRLAALLDVPLVAAAEHVVPIAVTAAESVENLRQWASNRCLNADAGGIYQSAGSKKRRRVNVDPSQN